MVKRYEQLRQHALAVLLGIAIGIPTASHADLDDIVYIKGTMTDEPEVFNIGTEAPTVIEDITTKYACDTMVDILDDLGYLHADEYPAKIDIAPMLPDELWRSVPQEVFESEAVKAALSPLEWLEECYYGDDPSSETVTFTMMFTTCSMTMLSGSTVMRWVVPPDATEAQMVFIDAETNQVLQGGANLERELPAVETFAKGTELKQTVSGPAGSKAIELEILAGRPGHVIRTDATYDSAKYTFEYEGSVMGGLNPADSMAGMTPILKSRNVAYVSSDVPGMDVIHQFYQTFRDYVAPAAGAGTLLATMIEQMAEVAEKGLPLDGTQTITVDLGGCSEVARS